MDLQAVTVCSEHLTHFITVISNLRHVKRVPCYKLTTLWFNKIRPLLYFQITSTNIGQYQ